MTPDEFTIQESFLEVGDGHSLYLQEWGNPKAKLPIIFLHGGPGSGCKDKHKQAFDPKFQRVIFFDQRGCGKSLPKGSLEHNTTADAIKDIEKLAVHLKLQDFVITGGSWGSCLALAYALEHPKRVRALVLSGIFTARRSEIDYLDNGGFRTNFPDLWGAYVASVPAKHRSDPSRYHYDQICGADNEAAKQSAYAYSELLEGPLLSLDDRYIADTYAEFDPDPMKIELHYLRNGCFIPENYIMDNAHRLTMPIWLVQGRYDMVCPPVTAYELHQKLPNSFLTWTISGHKAEHEAWNVMRSLSLQLTGENHG